MHVVLSFDSCLFSQSSSFFLELFLSSNLHIGLNSLSLGCFELFSFSGHSFTLLKSSLGSESIDLSLSIGSLFLELSESLDFTLLFFLHALSFLLGLEFSLVFCALVLGDFIILVLFFLGSSLFFDESLGIGFGCLLHEEVDFLPLGLMSCLIFLPHLFYVGLELDLFFVSEFLFFHSLDSSLLDLIDDDLGSSLSSCNLSDLSFFLLLKDLESLNFHHEVELLLLLDPFLLESLILLQLLVSDSDNLGVKDHLVHLLDIIKVIILPLLGLG